MIGMQRFFFSPKFWFWPAAALLVLSLHFWFPETSTGTTHDSYSPTAQGQKAFYRLVAEHPGNFVVARNRRPLTALLSSFPTDDVLCLLGPERPPTAEEWTAIIDWVRNGGSLLYAAQGKKPLDIPWLNIKYEPLKEQDDALQPKTQLVNSQRLAWWTDGKLDGSQGTTLVEYDGTRQAVAVQYGRGKAVVVATPLPFSNQLLTFGDNSVLAMRLLESAGSPEFVTFDESLNSSGTAKVVGILFDPLLRPVTIQILLVTVLFGWWHNRRFGPLTPSAVSPRQNIVEHTDMVGNLYWKSQDGHAVLRAYLRQLTQMLRLKTFKGNEDRVLEPIARRSGRPVSSLRKDLQLAFQAVRSKHVERRSAAKLIRRLALIRQAAHVTNQHQTPEQTITDHSA
jgi:hypothetical protein